MTGKICKVPSALLHHATKKFKWYMEKRSRCQRL